MPARVPEAARRAWGDELVAEIVPWLEEIAREQAVPRDQYRADIRELRDKMNERFKARLDHRFDQMNERFDLMYERMLTQRRWLIGSIALLGTVISILLAIGQFVK